MIGTRMLAVPLHRDGQLVETRNPATGRPLATGGDVVLVTPYWIRRERDGDVELRAPVVAASTADPPTDSPGDDAPATTTTPKKRRGADA